MAASRAVLVAFTLALVCTFALATAATEAAALTADEAAKAEAKALGAKFKFKAGKHEEAAELFLEAYALSRKPALLYNAARAFEEAGKLSEAKAAFEQYLGIPNLPAAGRKDARGHIDKLNKRLAARKAQDAKQAENKAAADKAAADKAAADKAAADKANADKAAARRRAAEKAAAEKAAADKAGGAGGVRKAPEPSRNKWVTYGLTGSAGLFVLLGVGGQLQAAQAMDEANAMDFAVDNKFDAEQIKTKKKDYDDKVAAAEAQQGSAVLSLTLGLGLGAWAAYRLLTPDPGLAEAGKTASSWHASPALMRSGTGGVGGFVLRGRF